MLLRANPIVANDTVELLTVIGQLVAAIAAVAALAFVGFQIRQARKTADFATLKEFLKDVKEYQDRLLTAPLSSKDTAFVEFMNFLEVYALALDKNLVPKVSRKLIAQTLCESVACIWKAPDCHPLIEKAYTSEEVFENIIKFAKKNEVKIKKLEEF
jgi:hypothetical protein